MPYDHRAIEKKWQEYWDTTKTFKSNNPPFTEKETKPKKFILDMFPYPSGAGLHVGHPKGYTATDIVSRYYHANGFNVLHTMGWDAFGLPAENYAIKTGTHPSVTTKKNIVTFVEQMKSLGFSYDWSREIDTTDPGYYTWTQWIFSRLFEAGLAYEQDLPINYCPNCKTGLANEEVLADNTCERCGTRVERRPIRQWVLKITDYAERLLTDLDSLDWSEGVKEMQRNWIGKSEGCEFRMFKVPKKGELPPEKNLGEFNCPNQLSKEKDRNCISRGVGLNCPAKFLSLEESIFQTATKVKKKNEILRDIDVTFHNNGRKITINSENILRHFSSKGIKEFHYRKGLLGLIYHAISDVYFHENIGYLIFKDMIIQIVLGQQSNGNYFVKTYYIADRLTDAYRKYKVAVHIHSASQDDFQQILEIRKKTELHTVDFSPEQFFVAKDGEMVVGFVRVQKCGEYTELGALYVDEAYRSKKLGYKLMAHAMEQTDAEEFYIDCKKSLLDYYRRFGFIECDGPLPFQMEKLEKVWKSYGRSFKDDDIRTNTIFMKIAKRDYLESIPSLSVYTTRIDTVYGMTYVVMAPDHPHVDQFITPENREVCDAYILEAKSKSDQDRTHEGKEKTGVFTGSYVINPFNHEAVPVWIADYVLGSYGTGAVMAVPAHDERDFEFAKKYNLPIHESIAQFHTDEKVREDKPTVQRQNVVCVVQNPETQETLCLKWKKQDWKSFIIGGVEKGETIIEAGIREIGEESGYKNIRFVRQLPSQEHLFWTPHKDINRSANVSVLLYELINTQLEDIAQEEHDKHIPIWVKNEEVVKFINLPNHALIFSQIFKEKAFTEDGVLVNSCEFSGLSSSEARKILTEKAELEGFGQKKVNYKLRDWLFSRQRYWGEPIPLIHIAYEDFDKLPRVEDPSLAILPDTAYIYDKKGTVKRCKNCTCQGGCTKLIINGKTFSKVYDGLKTKIIIDPQLPLTLPEVEKYEPTGDGASPLAHVEEWKTVVLADNLIGQRETNTMPQWAGSCWYYLRFMDPNNTELFAGKEALEYWKNVDEYVGGTEHAVLHLLYARFWHKFLYDIGVVPTKEPFQKLINVGMILAYAYERKDGGLVAVDLVEERNGKWYEITTGEEVKQVIAKMSKSLKNVINPNDIVSQYGADTLRLYEMSMSTFTDTAPWNTDAIIGVRRFLDKVYSAFTTSPKLVKEGDTLVTHSLDGSPLYRTSDDMKSMKLLHKTIKKVSEDIVDYKFNTAISSLMILMNEGIPSDPEFALEWQGKFLLLLHPFAPHIAEELWHNLSGEPAQSIYTASWPTYDEFMLTEDEVTIAVQINGKLRGTFQFLNGVAEEEVSEVVRADPNISKWLEGKEIIKEIFIPNKMLSIVIK